MEASIAPTGRFYRPELDVVRFLAFLFVFLHHTLPTTGKTLESIGRMANLVHVYVSFCLAGRFGLSLFFSLSAFLICELLLRERASSDTVAVKQFYIRRILRIWPLYYLIIALGAFVSLLPGGFSGDTAQLAWFTVFLPRLASLSSEAGNPVFPLWSISVEEQFYLFAPWIIKYFSRKYLYGFCVFLIACSNLWLYFLGKKPFPYGIPDYNSFVQFECFAGGILLCLVLRGRMPTIAIWQRLILFASGCSCWFIATFSLESRMSQSAVSSASWLLISEYGLAALGSILIIYSFLGIASALLPGWTIYLGRISFGLYVYHEFAMYITRHLEIRRGIVSIVPFHALQAAIGDGLTLVINLGLTILMAALSYRYFETPFLKIKKRHAVIESQPIAGTAN
jgi:peptidoglycan/LPS O-acetylase OafA/YrhL